MYRLPLIPDLLYVRRCFVRCLSKLSVGLLSACVIVACGPARPAFDTYHPRSTIDCSHHVDGSFFPLLDAELDGNSVGAYVFPIRDQAPLLEVTYDVKDGDTLRLESSEFAAVSADDATIGWAKANLLLNPLMPGEEPKLGDLPTELQGDRSVRGGDFPSNNKTYYRVVLSFDQHLPDQFDLHTPDAWL